MAADKGKRLNSELIAKLFLLKHGSLIYLEASNLNNSLMLKLFSLANQADAQQQPAMQ